MSARAYLSTKQAGEHLGVTPRTIRGYVSAGRLLPVNQIGHPRFTLQQLDAFMRQQSETNPSKNIRVNAPEIDWDPDLYSALLRKGRS